MWRRIAHGEPCLCVVHDARAFQSTVHDDRRALRIEVWHAY